MELTKETKYTLSFTAPLTKKQHKKIKKKQKEQNKEYSRIARKAFYNVLDEALKTPSHTTSELFKS